MNTPDMREAIIMNSIARLMIALLITLALCGHALAAAGPDIDAIVDRIDRIFRSDTSEGEMEMEVVTPNYSRTMSMHLWSEGLDKTFIHILSPLKDRGIATLRVDNEMWNYFPKINKVMKVPHSMMMSSWMGSDFTNDDLVKESSMRRDYTARLIDGPDPANMYYAEFIPREDSPIVWARIVVAVRKIDYIPVKEEFFDESGTLVRVMHLTDIREMGGRTLPTVLELVPLNKEGHKTVVRYKDIIFDHPLEPDVFTLRNLQRKRR